MGLERGINRCSVRYASACRDGHLYYFFNKAWLFNEHEKMKSESYGKSSRPLDHNIVV
jgi:hypothetical protein